MAEKLKNLFFTKDSISHFTDSIEKYYSKFDKSTFLKLIYFDAWDSLELKEKMRHTTICLAKCLPDDYLEALLILVKAAPEIKGFEGMVLPDFVELYGMDNWEESLNALGHFTRYASSEFAIRPFLDKDPELVIQYNKAWAKSDNDNVRRFASEGCRPRLPWAMVLPKFVLDPSPVVEVLELLKDDPSLFVRKSVANNLNDISKDNPDVALQTALNWYGDSANTNWIVKHGMRTLLKKGNIQAMRLFGFGDPSKIEVFDFILSHKKLKIGEHLKVNFTIGNRGSTVQKIRLEYGIDFVKSNKKTSTKIFQVTEREFAPGRHDFSRKHAFVDMTTRKHYPGMHKLFIKVNGVVKVSKQFELIK